MEDIIRNIFLSIILLMATSLSFAHSGDVLYVVGKVCDDNTDPIEYAVVSLVDKMNRQVKTILTNADGNFRLEGIIPGKYKLLITHLSYMSYKEEIDIYHNRELGRITLKAESYEIEEVKVFARAIQYGSDSYTISMHNNSLTRGKNAYEILRFLPYVTNRQGTLQILGQNVSRVRINGVLLSDVRELEAIQAEHLDKIEIVFVGRLDEFNNGSGGEINIELDRPKDRGYWGSVAVKSSMNFKYDIQGKI